MRQMRTLKDADEKLEGRIFVHYSSMPMDVMELCHVIHDTVWMTPGLYTISLQIYVPSRLNKPCSLIPATRLSEAAPVPLATIDEQQSKG